MELKITICSVVLNARNEIEKLIQSVLCQTYSNIEYILIDGQSTDGTIDVIQQYKNKISKIIIEKDDGLYNAMNKALHLATGDYILFLNAGDSFVSSYVVEGVVSSITNNQAVYYGDVILLNSQKNSATFWGGYFGKHRLCFENISHQAVFYPKSVYKNYSYDLRYKIFGDWMYNISLKAENVRFIYLKKIISFFELGGLSSLGDKDVSKNMEKIILNKFGFYYYVYFLLKKNIRVRSWIKYLKNNK
jgi:glycosyltransferase involved in cell wall biosynthesis